MNFLDLYWDSPWFLLGLLVVPLMMARYLGLGTEGRVPFPSVEELRLSPRGLLARLWWLPGLLRIVTVTLLVIVAARPQTEDRQVITGQGVDIMLALDVSGSMNAVDATEESLRAQLDQGERPRNRFESARDILKEFILSRKQDRLGLVIFGQQAWLKYPLTVDYSRLVGTLDGLVLDVGYQDPKTGKCINGCTVSGAGTAIGDALGRAYNRLRRSSADSRIIILITDGKQEAGALDPLAIARHIQSLPEDERPRVYTFQVGSQEQTWLPEFDFRARPVVDARGLPSYRKPPRPFPVDPALLRQIAELTGGRFYESYNAEKFQEDVADLERTVFTDEVQIARHDVFLPLLLLALWLLAFEWLLRFTRFRSLA